MSPTAPRIKTTQFKRDGHDYKAPFKSSLTLDLRVACCLCIGNGASPGSEDSIRNKHLRNVDREGIVATTFKTWDRCGSHAG